MMAWTTQDSSTGVAGLGVHGVCDHKTKSLLNVLGVQAGLAACRYIVNSLSPKSIFRDLNPFSELTSNDIGKTTREISAKAGQTSLLKCISSLSARFKRAQCGLTATRWQSGTAPEDGGFDWNDARFRGGIKMPYSFSPSHVQVLPSLFVRSGSFWKHLLAQNILRISRIRSTNLEAVLFRNADMWAKGNQTIPFDAAENFKVCPR